MNEKNVLVRSVDPNNLYPGIRVFDRASNREGEIIKIEHQGRGLPDIFVVFDDSDRPVITHDYPNLVIIDGD
jgi:hypothetical protein